MKRLAIDPQTDPLWQTLIDDRASSVFHTPSWMSVLSDTYGFQMRAYILAEDRAPLRQHVPIAGLPFCQVSDLRGERIISLPFSDFTDPLLSEVDEWLQLVNPLVKTGLIYKIRPLHNLIPTADVRFQLMSQARWHGLNIAPSPDRLWKGVHKSVRTAIRKARKNHVHIRIGQHEADLEAFYRMHLLVRKRKYRMVAQPYRFFHLLWQEFILKNRGRLMLAVHQNKIIAATIFLLWKETIYYKFNASLPEYLALNPNELLLWKGIEYGQQNGCSQMDFGLSDWRQQGLIFYKRKFASEEKTIHILQYTPESEIPSHQDQVNQLLPQLTELFTDASISDEITQRAGELLYKNFC